MVTMHIPSRLARACASSWRVCVGVALLLLVHQAWCVALLLVITRPHQASPSSSSPGVALVPVNMAKMEFRVIRKYFV